jgi:hypothetical protein
MPTFGTQRSIKLTLDVGIISALETTLNACIFEKGDFERNS